MIKIKYMHVVRCGKYKKYLALYEDGTWDELFMVPTKLGNENVRFDSKQFLGKPRHEAIELYISLAVKEGF